MSLEILGMLLAIVVPASPSPAPGASPAASSLKTIATVRSNTPYCTSLLQHFDGAVAPMIANDRTLDQVDVQLEDLKSVFKSPNYVQKFTTLRTEMVAYVGQMQKRLPQMQTEINRLRDGQTLAKTPADSAAMHALAEKMQLAYNKQMQLTNDLLGVTQGMMDYDVFSGDHPIGGNDEATLNMPADMKDIKSYLRFDGQRDVIADAESKAGDMAYSIASTTCK